ncbi:hypothetical protein [Streptomyces sp. NPDC007905]|uniref:hypothetical protein n=1 Tax=Streptomyces sp. NPDC007905 TaxID=3364788 RepID=UPI0036E3B93D
MDSGLETAGELVEPGSHRPMAFETVDAALNSMPGLVVVALKAAGRAQPLPRRLRSPARSAVTGMVLRIPRLRK